MSTELENWRKQIDAIDEKILTNLAKRLEIVKKIGKFKKKQKISALDTKRWEDILNINLKKSDRLKLPKELVKDLLNLIHKYSLKIQKDYND